MSFSIEKVFHIQLKMAWFSLHLILPHGTGDWQSDLTLHSISDHSKKNMGTDKDMVLFDLLFLMDKY